MLLELNPLISLFTDTELTLIQWDLRLTVWLLAFLWHLLAAMLIFALLKFKQLDHRFRRTLESYFGVFILFQLAGVFLQLIPLVSVPNVIQTFMLIVWLSWSCCVFGYVFGRALDLKFYQGAVVALLVNALSYFLAFLVIALPFSNQLVELFHKN